MAVPPPARSIFGQALKNFINSFRPRQIRGNLVGSDHFGNEYYEIPADPKIGKRKPSRWFKPPQKNNFVGNETPAEWESWLCGRREKPPQEEEVLRNCQIALMKKKNAAVLEAGYKKDVEVDKILPRESRGYESYPQYDEYETTPGQRRY